jgi:predicted enzyme related to lactoylglutathione lyase
MAGKLVHFEIYAKDADRATGFYSSLFGWEFSDSGMPGIDYRLLRTGEDQGGAVFAPEDGKTGCLKVYFDTDDIDASIAKVREGGGEADDKQPIPSIGWFAGCKDTEGNEFSLYQNDESAPMPDGPPQG